MSIGFFGKILRIDLSNEKIDTISPPIEIYRNYIGGYGLGCRLLYELMPPKIDPLSENIIALVIDVISRIPKPRRRLNFNPFMAIPKSLNLYFLNFMTTSPGKTNKIVFARK